MSINADLRRPVSINTEAMPWVASPMLGVERRMLERDGPDGTRRATSLVRYAPGSRFSPHSHPGGEEFFVLDGVFSDEVGDYPAGTYVRNPPGSRHAPHSVPGTTIFVKLQQFAADDGEHVVIDTNAGPWLAGPTAGIDVMALHAHGAERVALERWRAGTRAEHRAYPGGAEIFVLEGRFADTAGRSHGKGAWLRIPPGGGHALASPQGGVFYLKHGHLG